MKCLIFAKELYLAIREHVLIASFALPLHGVNREQDEQDIESKECQ